VTEQREPNAIEWLFAERERQKQAAREAAQDAAATSAQQSSSQQYNPFAPSPQVEREGVTSSISDVSETRRAAWVASMLRHAIERLSESSEGNRNDELNIVAYTLGGIVHLGLDERAARDELFSLALRVGLTQSETESTLQSGFAAGVAEPMSVELAERTLLNGTIDPVDVDGSLQRFWGERELLQHIFDFARSRRVAPWAALGVVLARAMTCVPPQLVLPPLVGGYGSLNVFVGIVGASGAGKGGAERAAAEAITMPYFATATVGSGEGIVHSYVKRDKGEVRQHETAVLFSVPEVDTLAAVSGRSGATLLPELRRAWSGEALGFAYADPVKRLNVHEHAYRLTLILGVQPRRAGALLKDVDGGTPQRFLWLPAVDRYAPDVAPSTPKPWHWSAPDIDVRARRTPGIGHSLMDVCHQARKIIDDARLARLRHDADMLDGHLLLTQLKTAAALCVLDGRLDVSNEDWLLAETIMRVSQSTRAAVTETLSGALRERDAGQADSYARRSFRVAELTAERDADHEERAAQRIVTLLQGGVLLARAELRRGLRQNHRHAYDDAIAGLIDAGQLVAVEDSKGVTRYALSV
jgi:hypothetical protein